MVNVYSKIMCSTSVHIQWDLRKDRDLGIKDLFQGVSLSRTTVGAQRKAECLNLPGPNPMRMERERRDLRRERLQPREERPRVLVPLYLYHIRRYKEHMINERKL